MSDFFKIVDKPYSGYWSIAVHENQDGGFDVVLSERVAHTFKFETEQQAEKFAKIAAQKARQREVGQP